ncbi:MAG TPA: isoprenylcysteine carboxylmethyltransferase family protein [Candidatus Aquicultor sp.]|jgi:protein-S-isoprenylcysteine O-methyltransferase Ste14
MGANQLSLVELRRKAYVYFFVAILVISAIFFLPAGTLAYWEAWVYLAVLFIPAFLAVNYLLKNEPELVERRMRFREKEPEQKLIAGFSYLYFILAFILPGFDRRFGWSDVPIAVVLLADVFVVLGYGIVFLTFRENPYASRTVEVTPGQTVISTGPYAIIRHPMYLGSTLLYTFSPLALGSYWAMIPALLIIPILVARILNEESVLAKELKGYREYMLKTRYRLLPGIW